MKVVVIPFVDQRNAAGEGIAMSYWCRDMGLVREVDYDWALMSATKEIHFRFYGDNESYSSLFALKWAGHEI